MEKLIKSCNAITNTVTDYKKSGLKRKLFLEQSDDENKNKKDKNNFIKEDKKNNKEINPENNKNPYTENKNITENNNTNEDNANQNSKKRKQKKKHFKTYLCEFCNKAYSNGQGLGGHMSRIHPNQSYKYKDKIEDCGIRLPFVIDLSCRLLDNGLINNVYVDKRKLVDELWK